MKKTTALLLAFCLLFSVAVLFSSCGGQTKKEAALTIAVPNDTTNEARALMLLEAQGIIKLKEGAGKRLVFPERAERTASDIVEGVE